MVAADFATMERVAVRQHDDVGDQPDPLGDRGDVGQRRERVERVVAAGVEPLVRRRRVVGERDAVEPRGLGGAGEPGEALTGDELRVVRVGDERIGGPVLHEMGSDRWPCHDRGTAGAADTDPPESERYMHEEPTASGPLSWMRVVDLTDLRGALCARILADLGADVIRVERPRSARLARARVPQREQARRRARPRRRRATGRDSTSCSATPTCSSRTSPDVRDALGSTPTTSPPRTRTSCTSRSTDLGLSGPRAGWHLEPLPALAASGALWASGFPQLPPCNGPGHLAHDCASVYGAIGAVAAVLDRDAARRRHRPGRRGQRAGGRRSRD